MILLTMATACTGGGGGSTAPPNPLPALDPGLVGRGRQVYITNCAICHGQSAEGASNWQKPDSLGNMPPPPHDDAGHTWRHRDQQLREVVLDGLRDPFNKTPDLTMPPFRGKLSDEEIEAVIIYFKSLWSEEHRRYQLNKTQKAEQGTGADAGRPR